MKQLNNYKNNFGNGIRIAALGDSITEYSKINYFDIACYLSDGKLFNAGNFGYGGQTYDVLLTNMPNVIEAKPDVLIIQNGVNDIGQTRPYTSMYAELEQIILLCIDNGIEPVISKMPWCKAIDKDEVFKMHIMQSALASKYHLKMVSLWDDFIDTDTIHPTREVHWEAALKLLEQLDIQGQAVQLPYVNSPLFDASEYECLANNCLFESYSNNIPINWTGVLNGQNINYEITSGAPVGNGIRLTANEDLEFHSELMSYDLSAVDTGDLLRVSMKLRHYGDNISAYVALKTNSDGSTFSRSLLLSTSASEGIVAFEYRVDEEDNLMQLILGISISDSGTIVEYSQVSIVNLTKEGFDF